MMMVMHPPNSGGCLRDPSRCHQRELIGYWGVLFFNCHLSLSSGIVVGLGVLRT